MRYLSRASVVVLAMGLCLPSLWADEAGAMRAFDRAKRTDPELLVFLKHMPKGADLHVHVSGAVYSDYMLDAAIAKGLTYDPATGQFGTDPTKTPAKNLLTNNTLLYQFLNAASMRGWLGGGQTGHDHFFDTFGIFGGALGALDVSDQLAEVIGRAKAQDEQYMELMVGVSPSSAQSAYFADLPSSTNMEAALDVLRPRLKKLLSATTPYLDAREQVGRRLGQRGLTDAAEPITVRYIWSCNRLSAPDAFFAQAAAGIYLAANEPRVVAMNMVAPEDHPLSRTNFLSQMRMIDFLWNRLGKPSLTLHAGELTPSISPVETMRDRIRKTIEIGHARRIGHGVSIAWEDDAEGLMDEMRREGIAVEICLSSNASILGVSGIQHPFRLYKSHGVPVFLNTDDEGVSRTTMTLEWIRAIREQHVTYPELKEMSRNSLEYSFLKGQSIYSDRNFDRLKPPFIGCRLVDWKPDAEASRFLKRSEKARVELRYERALADFEAKFR